MPKWLATSSRVSPVKAFGLGVVLAAVNPKNLILTLGAAAGLAQLRADDDRRRRRHRGLRGHRQPHHRRARGLRAGRRGEGEERRSTRPRSG